MALISQADFIEMVNKGGWSIYSGTVVEELLSVGYRVENKTVTAVRMTHRDLFEIDIVRSADGTGPPIKWYFRAVQDEFAMVNDSVITIYNGYKVILKLVREKKVEKMNEQPKVQDTKSVAKLGSAPAPRDYDHRKPIAENLQKIYRELEGKKTWFTIEDYEKIVGHTLEQAEREFIEMMVGWGLLSYENGNFAFASNFAEWIEVWANPGNKKK